MRRIQGGKEPTKEEIAEVAGLLKKLYEETKHEPRRQKDYEDEEDAEDGE